MEFKEFLNTFVSYNKRNYIKLVIYSVLLFYFAFLIYYNHFRIILGYDLIYSWEFGIIYSLITTFIIVILIDILRVLLILKKDRGRLKLKKNDEENQKRFRIN